MEDRIRQRTANVVVVGVGNAGLPMAVELARADFRVIGYDVAEAKVEAINAGHSPVHHVADEIVGPLSRTGLFRATTDESVLNFADVVLICVPTPLQKGNTPDLHYVLDTGRAIASHLGPDTLVILQSTCPPGTTNQVLRPALEQLGGLSVAADFYLVCAPERIDPGNRHFTVRNTPKLVGGVTVESTRLACLLFETFIERVEAVSSPEVAEMAKLVENTFRFVNISFANEMALLCERLHVNVWVLFDASASKPFAFMAHQPSAGVGGDCIPVVPFLLDSAARDVGLDLRMVRARFMAIRTLTSG